MQPTKDKRRSMSIFTLARFVVVLVLAGVPFSVSAGLLSATRTVIAILANDLFTGDAVGHLDGAGTITMRSQRNPGLTCHGEFTSSKALGGAGDLQCSDGTVAT